MQDNKDHNKEDLDDLTDPLEVEPDAQLGRMMNTFGNKLTKVDYSADHSVWREQRLKIVALELMAGYSPGQIFDKYGEEWNVSYNNLTKRYVPLARKMIATEILTGEEDIRIDLLAKYGYLYQLAMQQRNYVEARKVLDSITKMTQTLQANVNINAKLETIQLVQIANDDKIIEMPYDESTED